MSFRYNKEIVDQQKSISNLERPQKLFGLGIVISKIFADFLDSSCTGNNLKTVHAKQLSDGGSNSSTATSH